MNLIISLIVCSLSLNLFDQVLYCFIFDYLKTLGQTARLWILVYLHWNCGNSTGKYLLKSWLQLLFRAMVSWTTSLNTCWIWTNPKFCYAYFFLWTWLFTVQNPVTMDNELQSRDAWITSLYFPLKKSTGVYDTSKLEYPYLTEYPDAVQCKTGYHLELEAETVVWYGSYAG